MCTSRVTCSVLVCVLLALILTTYSADARPTIFSRQRRVTDHRIQELNLLDTLQKLKNSLVTQPVGFNKVDVLKLGRRRRSAERLLWKLVHDASPEEENASNDEDVHRNEIFQAESEEVAEPRIAAEELDDVLVNKVLQELEEWSKRTGGYVPGHLPVRLPE